MTTYTGKPPRWDHADCYVRFDIPDGGSGRAFIPARDEATALTTFHNNWAGIAELAKSRYEQHHLVNGEVVIDVVPV
jgi:hypothetical protein